MLLKTGYSCTMESMGQNCFCKKFHFTDSTKLRIIVSIFFDKWIQPVLGWFVLVSFINKQKGKKERKPRRCGCEQLTSSSLLMYSPLKKLALKLGLHYLGTVLRQLGASLAVWSVNVYRLVNSLHIVPPQNQSLARFLPHCAFWASQICMTCFNYGYLHFFFSILDSESQGFFSLLAIFPHNQLAVQFNKRNQ